MNVPNKVFRNLVLLLVVSLLLVGGVAHNASAQEPPDPKFNVFCSTKALHINIEDWTPGETLTLYANGEKFDEMATSDEGAAHFTGSGEGLVEITLQGAEGNVLVAGRVDCTVPPPDVERLDVEPTSASVFLGTPFPFRAFGLDENGGEVPVDVVWTTDSGSISPDGVVTVSEPGESLVTATMVGDGYSSTFIMNVTASAPPRSVTISPEEITVLVGETVFFEVVGVDADGNESPLMPTFSSDGGEMGPFGAFTAMEPGDYTVTAIIEGTEFEVSATVHALPVIERIEIRPQIEEIEVGETQQFEVVGIGEDGEDVPLPADPIWSAELGGISSSGLYTATTEGEETVSVVVPRQAATLEKSGIGVLAGTREPFQTILTFKVVAGLLDAEEDEVSEGSEDEVGESDQGKGEEPELTEEDKAWFQSFYDQYQVFICLCGFGVVSAVAAVIYLFFRRRND